VARIIAAAGPIGPEWIRFTTDAQYVNIWTPLRTSCDASVTLFRHRILALSGSLRRQSSNTAALQAAILMAPADMLIELHPPLDALPFFNPDLDTESVPPQVREFRGRIGLADGLLICSPEYARGIAGVIKNALDWLVSSSEFPDKPVAVINTSQRATHADAALRLTLATMSARLIGAVSFMLPLQGRPLDADGIAADSALAATLQTALDALAKTIRLGAETPATPPEAYRPPS
jgi:chromate reductase